MDPECCNTIFTAKYCYCDMLGILPKKDHLLTISIKFLFLQWQYNLALIIHFCKSYSRTFCLLHFVCTFKLNHEVIRKRCHSLMVKRTVYITFVNRSYA